MVYNVNVEAIWYQVSIFTNRPKMNGLNVFSTFCKIPSHLQPKMRTCLLSIHFIFQVFPLVLPHAV